MKRRNKGFSLIELVAVIVIMGIMATASVEYIRIGSQIYIEASVRQKTLGQSRFIVERLTREIRASVPSSVRIITSSDNTESCIEFIPIKASGAYRTDDQAVIAPFAPESRATMEAISWNGGYTAGDNLYIYATQSAHMYGAASRSAVIASVAADAVNNEQIAITFAANAMFPKESPRQRYYTADHSISFCIDDDKIYRYQLTSFSAGQLLPSTGLTGGVLMAEGISNSLSTEPAFSYNTAAHTRNSVVNLYLEFAANQDENMFFNHEVHIANVP